MRPTSLKFAAALVVLAVAGALLGTGLLFVVLPAQAQTAAAASLPGEVWTWGLAAAAASTALAALGAGFAVAKVGTAAVGALAEKPELFGRLLIFVGLAEGIAIYGLIVSILILNRLS